MNSTDKCYKRLNATTGVYTDFCECVSGYQRDGSGKCVDIDECTMSELHCAGKICQNTVGSFICGE